jgi:hypothetical protein
LDPNHQILKIAGSEDLDDPMSINAMVQAANVLIERLPQSLADAGCVCDLKLVQTSMPTGQPRQYYLPDGLHLSAQGELTAPSATTESDPCTY